MFHPNPPNASESTTGWSFILLRLFFFTEQGLRERERVGIHGDETKETERGRGMGRGWKMGERRESGME